MLIASTLCASFNTIIKSVTELQNITLPDTRWIATQWILKNMPQKLNIAREGYNHTPPIEQFSDSYAVTHLGYGFATNAEEIMKVNKQDYVILSSGVYDRYVNYPNRYPAMAQGYQKFFREHQLIKEFSPDWKMSGGPTIRIYKINNPG